MMYTHTLSRTAGEYTPSPPTVTCHANTHTYTRHHHESRRIPKSLPIPFPASIPAIRSFADIPSKRDIETICNFEVHAVPGYPFQARLRDVSVPPDCSLEISEFFHTRSFFFEFFFTRSRYNSRLSAWNIQERYSSQKLK